MYAKSITSFIQNRKSRRPTIIPDWNVASNRQYWIQSNTNAEVEHEKTTAEAIITSTTPKPYTIDHITSILTSAPTTAIEEEPTSPTTTIHLTSFQSDDSDEELDTESRKSSTVPPSISNGNLKNS